MQPLQAHPVVVCAFPPGPAEALELAKEVASRLGSVSDEDLRDCIGIMEKKMETTMVY